MKKTYIKLLVFLLAFVGLNSLLNFSYKELIYRRTDNERKFEQLKEYDGELKYLFLGDSHSQNAIDPSIIGNGFNFSSANENFIQTYFKFIRVLKKIDQKPQTIVLPIDPSSFSSFRAQRFVNPSELLTFANYFTMTIRTKKIYYLSTWFENSFFMYVGKYATINKYLEVAKLRKFSNMKLGFKGRRGNLENEQDVAKVCTDKANLYLKGYHYFDPAIKSFFVDILEYCDNNGIAVYLMKMPLAKEYVQACRDIFPLNEYYKEIHEIAGRFSSVKKVYDFQDFFFHQQSYLRNPDHVNIDGAKIFSEMLASEFLKLEQHEDPL